MIKITRKDVFLTLTIFVAVFFGTLITVSQALDTPIWKFIIQFPEKLYMPNYNIFYVKEWGLINSLSIFHSSLILTMFILFLYHKVRHPETLIRSLPKVVILTYLFGILTLGIFDCMMKMKYSYHYLKNFSTASTDQKTLLLFDKLYTFPRDARNKISGRHQGTMITDEDMSNEANITKQRILSYFLYPSVSVRFNNGTPNDVFLYYKKSSSIQDPSNDLKIISASDNLDLILAIKDMENTPDDHHL
ncbi:MAG: hypothetical protein KBD53_04490 [Candidatus Omnitrophica bacterium]|nr:hypothetical protein [Candidatus Omnitrophota bacterium]